MVAIGATDAGGVAGVLTELEWGSMTVVTDTSWKVSPTAASGWEDLTFNDSGWSNATSCGVYGVSPWLKHVSGFPAGSSAQWIRTDDNFNDDTAYLRYSFMVP